MNNLRLEPKLETIPDPPKKFGDDGGHFYRYYDALADELDEDMVKSLKAQLDGILIFAGLFAGVNTAFLALTLPAMSADPADDTNALLLQLVTGGNGTIRSAEDFPSATFAPSPGISWVNKLFSLSLTFAIISSFLAVLGQQWLVYYRKRSGGGAEHQRWEQLRRYQGAKRWHLEAILGDILPGLLQSALVIFCLGFLSYVETLGEGIYNVIIGPMAIAVGVLLLMGVVGAWDRWCPFKSPLSHLLQVLGKLMWSCSIAATRLASSMKRFLTHRSRNRAQWSLPSWKEVWSLVVCIVNWALDHALDRSGENVAELEAVAAKRVLCTSEDFNALLYTAANLHGMTSKESIECFLGDETVYKRLEELWEGGRHSAGSSELLAGAFSRAFLRLIFIGGSAELLVEPRYRQRYSEALLPSRQDPTSLHPLKQNVEFLDGCIDMGLKSLHTHRNGSIWLLHYCQILKVTVDETYLGSGLFERWLNYIITEYSISGDFKPHVICLVAWGVHMLNVGIVIPRKPLAQRVLNKEWEPGRELEELEELELVLLKRKRLELEQVWEKQQQEEREKREEREEREERQWWPRKLTQAHVLALVLGPVLAAVAMVIWLVDMTKGVGKGAMAIGAVMAGLAGLALLLGLLLELRWDWWPRKWMRALVLVLVLVLVLMLVLTVGKVVALGKVVFLGKVVILGPTPALPLPWLLKEMLGLWLPVLLLVVFLASLLGLLGVLWREWWPRKRMRTRVLVLALALVLLLLGLLLLPEPLLPIGLGLAVLASLLGLLLELRLRWQQQRHRTGRGQPGQGRRGELFALRGEINQLRGKINPEDFIQVQQQRVKVVQEFVRSVGWKKPLLPEGGLDRPQDTVFGLIKEAFGPYPSQSPQRRDNIHVWLLEQALVISTMTGNFDGLKFVATTSVELLCSLHEGEDADAGRDSWHNQDDCLTSTKILSQCLQALGEHSNSQGASQTIRNVGQQLEQYLPQLTADFEFPRCSTSTLSTWLEIRETLEKLVGGWSGGSNPRLKAAFDAIESATLNIKVAPKTDGDPADPSPIQAADEQAGPSGPAITERFGENAGEPRPAHRMQEDAGGCSGDQNASVVCSVDSPIKEGGGADQRKQLEDTSPGSVAQDNSLRRGTSDVQIEFNDCFPLRDQMLL